MARCAAVGESRIFLDRLTVCAESGQPSGKDSEDGEQVLGKLVGGGERNMIENHDAATVRLDQPLDEIKAEPRQLVSVGDHNVADFAAQDAFQYGTQSLALEVESAADVGNDGVIGESFAHEGDLAVKVVALLAAGHAAVANRLICGDDAEQRFDVIEAFSSRCALILNFALFRPLP